MQPTYYLLAKELANYPSANEGRAYPGVKRLAEKLGCVDRTVNRGLERLAVEGLLITRRGGPGKTARRFFAFQTVPIFEKTQSAHAAKSDQDTTAVSHLDASPYPTPEPADAANGLPKGEPAETLVLDGEVFLGEITFNEFWLAAGQRDREGPARSTWRKLSADDRRAIALRLERDGRLNMRGMHPSTWLVDRLWEEAGPASDEWSEAAEAFAEAIARGRGAPSVVELAPGTQEWHTERDRKIAAGEPTTMMDQQASRGRGWSVYR